MLIAQLLIYVEFTGKDLDSILTKYNIGEKKKI